MKRNKESSCVTNKFLPVWYLVRSNKVSRRKERRSSFQGVPSFELKSREISFRGGACGSIKRRPLVLILEIVERQTSEPLPGGPAISQQYRGLRSLYWKRTSTGVLYRDVDRKFLAPIPLSMRGARELSNPKDFRSVAPLSTSRYVEFQFGSSCLATSPRVPLPLLLLSFWLTSNCGILFQIVHFPC